MQNRHRGALPGHILVASSSARAPFRTRAKRSAADLVTAIGTKALASPGRSSAVEGRADIERSFAEVCFRTLSRPMQGSARALCGRRVEVNIKSRDLAIPGDDEIHTGVRGRFAFRPRAPRQASRIVQNLGRAMRRINIMWMLRSEIAGELVQCVLTDESAGRHVQYTVIGIKFLNC